jgi:imidazolonepropionase
MDNQEEKADGIWISCNISPTGNPDSFINEGAMVVLDGQIVWIGKEKEIPAEFNNSGLAHHDVGNHWITPGLIDCHTHLVYGGNRAAEFSMRLAGASYEEISCNGGGIMSTVHSTRQASEDSLFSQSSQRLEALLSEGVTTIEIKSGYGLDLDTERKMLRVARRLSKSYPVNIYTTFLGAHALPPEYKGRADDYIKLVCEEMLPILNREKLVDAVDVFCEHIGFSVRESEQVCIAASKLNLPIRMHAEQLSNIGATQLATRFKALSVDHLEYLEESDVMKMKENGTVAVLLPGAYYFLRETKSPPLGLLRDYKVPIAISTDSNPGTSPTTSLLLMLNMSCTLLKMTTTEALLGVTTNAALALGKNNIHGLLAAGRAADFAVWSVNSLTELAYWSGFNPCVTVVHQGYITKRD